MFDSEYFRTTLQADVDATAGPAVVELYLSTGHMLRLRSVLAVHTEYVTLEAYQDERVEGLRPPRWKAEALPGQSLPPTLRAVVAYGGIVALTITPEPDAASRAGFVR
ncbi:MAG TPA: hypothetical protein VFS08_13290 [Gemmatimonadaceae bacterium]|nr:hypothetical protein [Gemmatimonadaceae bacterium]